MKRVLAVCLLIIALALPCFAGHTQPGNVPCEDGTPGCVPDNQITKTYRTDTTSDLGSEWLLVLVVLAVLYKFKA